MKTLEQVYTNYKSECLDNRDLHRLMDFVPEEDLLKIKIELKDEYKGSHVAIPFTRENILKQLEKDVKFGFEKALDQRGISSSLMYAVVAMWNWILQDGLQDFEDYAQYGLPLFKATAIKYGFGNPIGDNIGNEEYYSE